MSEIADALRRVRDRIAAACNRCGRSVDSVRLVAVTKTVPAERIRQLLGCGHDLLGENRVQEALGKQPLVGSGARWHLVGHLQRNKVARTLPLASLIHSVDSPRLLAAINDLAAKLPHPTKVLLEVNISGDESKHGWPAEEVEKVVAHLDEFPNIRVAGLMGMASLIGDLDRARAEFASLRRLRDRLANNCPHGSDLTELSMGMSRDFPAAIAEGATIVRVGSALYEGLS